MKKQFELPDFTHVATEIRPSALRTGTAGDDSLYGTTGNDSMDGLGGNDWLEGNAGNDTMNGHAGHDWLDGGSGNDQIYGGNGDDTIIGGIGADTLYGGGGNDVFIVYQGEGGDVILGGSGTDTLFQYELSSAPGRAFSGVAASIEHVTFEGGDGNDTITGGALSNVLSGNGGHDILSGSGNSSDTIYGGNGNDTITAGNDGAGSGNSLYGDNGHDSIIGGTAADYIDGGAGNDTLTGGLGDDTIYGSNGSDLLDGGAGDDFMSGGTGNDTYMVDSLGDTIEEYAGEGWDLVISSLTWTLADTLESLRLSGNAAIDAYGNAGANALIGNDADNILDGRDGRDVMSGLGGNDTYYVNQADDVVRESANGGTDLVISAVDYTLAANVENLTLRPGSAIRATGNALDNVLTGNTNANVLVGGAGADVLDGAGGRDTMEGGTGDDRYYVDRVGDVVIEQAGEGNDTIHAFFDYELTDLNIENLVLEGGAIYGTGNALANLIVGNALVNDLSGGAGNDTLDGGEGIDTLRGGEGDDHYILDTPGDTVVEYADEGIDTVHVGWSYSLALMPAIENVVLEGEAEIDVTGNGLDNHLTGNGAANVLNGGLGNDTMEGGAGNDQYHVDSLGDVVIEAANGGRDLVSSRVDFRLGAHVEDLILAGTDDLTGIGNGLGNNIRGNSGNNLIEGRGGNDYLDGGIGADTLIGGSGDDVYFVDNVNDQVIELANGGTDSVLAWTSFNMQGQFIENVYLQGEEDLVVTGNTLDNFIVGNSGDNTLIGGEGNDTLRGGRGDDSYYVTEIGDRVEEGANGGMDIVRSTVSYTLSDWIEELVLIGPDAVTGIGNDLDNWVSGSEIDNVLEGGRGNDTLAGMEGSDTMRGGEGDDTYFVIDTTDRVVEFSNGGYDRVMSTVSFSIEGQWIEEITLLGDAIWATGNGIGNLMIGNDISNSLNGRNGNDTLDGGGGADSLWGGLGDDTFIVDNAQDLPYEYTDQGFDTVLASVSFRLLANVEALTLTGTAVKGWGNAEDNVLTGNARGNALYGLSGDDWIDGKEGSDTLFGGTGADSFVFSTALGIDNHDVVVDFNAGIDKIVLSSDIFTLLEAGELDASLFAIGIATGAEDRIIYDSESGALLYDVNGSALGGAQLIATLEAGLAITASDFLVI